MLSDSQIQTLVRLLSLAGALILVSQVLEIWSVTTPGLTGNQPERGLVFLGALAARIPLMVLADVLLFAYVVYEGSRGALRLMGWLHLAITLVLGVALLSMARRPGQLARIAGLRIGVTLGLTALLTLLAGSFSVRHSRKHKWIPRKRTRTTLITDTDTKDHRPPDPS